MFHSRGDCVKSYILWTAVCSFIAALLAAVLSKALGIDARGWDGGVGAGIGVVIGPLIAAQLNKTKQGKTEENSTP